MTNSQRIVWASFLAFLVLGAARAEARDQFSQDIGGSLIRFEPPEGYCLLDRNDPSDINMITYLERAAAGMNQVIAVFAECGALNDWRAGRQHYLEQYGYMATPLQLVGQSIKVSQAEVNNQLRPTFSNQDHPNIQAVLEDATTRAHGALDSMEVQNVRVGESKLLGVLGEDDNGFYSGVLVGLSIDGQQEQNLGIFSTALLVDKLVYLYLYDRYTGQGSQIRGLLDQVKRASARHKVINR